MIIVAWFDDSQKALLFKIEGAWTWEEYYQSLKDADALMDASPHQQVHGVLDFSKGTIFPSNVVSNIARSLQKINPKTGLTIVIGASAFLHVLFRIITRVAPAKIEKVRFVTTIEEVPAIINSTST